MMGSGGDGNKQGGQESSLRGIDMNHDLNDREEPATRKLEQL